MFLELEKGVILQFDGVQGKCSTTCIVKKVEGVIFDLWRKAMESSPCFVKEGNG